MIKMAIIGAAGRMGKECIEVIKNHPDTTLVGAVEKKNHTLIGKPLGFENITYIDEIEKIIEKPDVIIDFSNPQSTFSFLSWAIKNKVNVCIGTTGFSEDEILKIKSTSKNIGILLSPNMSIGVNIFFEIVAFSAKLFDKTYHREIIEIHHRHKKDAPSGTAKRLGEILATKMGKKLEEVAVFNRKEILRERENDEIGISSIRGGGVIGEHSVLFLGNNDRVEITHIAGSRTIFAEGAIISAKWLAGKPAGFYNIKDVIFGWDEDDVKNHL